MSSPHDPPTLPTSPKSIRRDTPSPIRRRSSVSITLPDPSASAVQVNQTSGQPTPNPRLSPTLQRTSDAEHRERQRTMDVDMALQLSRARSQSESQVHHSHQHGSAQSPVVSPATLRPPDIQEDPHEHEHENEAASSSSTTNLTHSHSRHNSLSSLSRSQPDRPTSPFQPFSEQEEREFDQAREGGPPTADTQSLLNAEETGAGLPSSIPRSFSPASLPNVNQAHDPTLLATLDSVNNIPQGLDVPPGYQPDAPAIQLGNFGGPLGGALGDSGPNGVYGNQPTLNLNRHSNLFDFEHMEAWAREEKERLGIKSTPQTPFARPTIVPGSILRSISDQLQIPRLQTQPEPPVESNQQATAGPSTSSEPTILHLNPPDSPSTSATTTQPTPRVRQRKLSQSAPQVRQRRGGGGSKVAQFEGQAGAPPPSFSFATIPGGLGAIPSWDNVAESGLGGTGSVPGAFGGLGGVGSSSAAGHDRPYRFSFYSNALSATIHSRSLCELPAEGQTFEQLFNGRASGEDGNANVNGGGTSVGTETRETSRPSSTRTGPGSARMPTQPLQPLGFNPDAKRPTIGLTSALGAMGGVGMGAAGIAPGLPGNVPAYGGAKGTGPVPGSTAGSLVGMGVGGPGGEAEERTWWLDVLSPSDEEMKMLSKVFGIHPLTTEDILMEETREKIELFRNYYFVCFRSFDQDPYSPTYLEPLNMYVVVFREGTLSFHFRPTPHPSNVRRRIKQLKDYISVTSDWISYALIDDITDAFGPLIQSIEYEVDSIDELVLILKEAEQSDMLRRIGTCRKKVMGLLRLMGNKADVVKGLAKRCNENWRVAPTSDIGLYLSDIQDHLITMTQNLNHYEKILSRSHSNYLAQISIEMTDANNQINDVLSKLTALGTVLIPMNLVTGLWGMNVHVPGEDVEGYAWFISIIAALVAFALVGGYSTYKLMAGR